MPLDYNIQNILKQYDTTDDDFGFSAVSEAEYNSVISKSAETADDYKARLEEVEKLVIPFLQKLYKTADKEYIYWPNRKPIIESQINKILKLTRG
jgi:hypothetical protein